MKKPFRFVPVLLLLLGACRTSPEPERDLLPKEDAPPPHILSALEQLRLRVRQNRDVVKYFLLDDEGRIVIKADFSNALWDYEVVYDVANARILDASVYEVDFIITEKNTGASVDDSLVWTPEAGIEGVLLSLDDYYTEAWEQYFDLFDRYGGKVTFFIQGAPGFAESGAKDPALFCAAALEKGHDIGFHSINHWDLRKVSLTSFFRETLAPLESFREKGIPVSSFAYPYGFSEPWMHEILLRSFGSVRGYGATFRLYDEDDIRSGHIISRAIDNTVIREEERFQESILTMLRAVKFLDNQQILPLTTHDISEEAAWGITPGRLEFLLEAVSNLRLKFYLYRDFCR